MRTNEDTFLKLKSLNQGIEMYHVLDDAFRPYGRLLLKYGFTDFQTVMDHTEIPESGNRYIASLSALEQTKVAQLLQQHFFGDQEIQVGYCNGVNSTLNGLEYHKSSEVNFAATDFVLLLGKVQDITSNAYVSNQVKAFYVPKGSAIEIYATTLHYAPCKVDAFGFRCVVALPKGTNSPISSIHEQVEQEDALLFMRNKWLMVHPTRQEQIRAGAYPGITGENIEVSIT